MIFLVLTSGLIFQTTPNPGTLGEVKSIWWHYIFIVYLVLSTRGTARVSNVVYGSLVCRHEINDKYECFFCVMYNSYTRILIRKNSRFSGAISPLFFTCLIFTVYAFIQISSHLSIFLRHLWFSSLLPYMYSTQV